MQLLTLTALLVAATISTAAASEEEGKDPQQYFDREGQEVKPETVQPQSSVSFYKGIVYTRWGKKTCASGAELVYEGIAGGSHYTHEGGGANYVCLPKVPEYQSNTEPVYKSYMYGVEYQSHGKFFGKHDYNAPCAVCFKKEKTTQMMVPGWDTCPSPWTTEYTGYLVTEYHTHNRKVHVCLDKNPDIIANSKANTDGALFYFTTCTGMGHCTHKRIIYCAVCSR